MEKVSWSSLHTRFIPQLMLQWSFLDLVRSQITPAQTSLTLFVHVGTHTKKIAQETAQFSVTMERSDVMISDLPIKCKQDVSITL